MKSLFNLVEAIQAGHKLKAYRESGQEKRDRQEQFRRKFREEVINMELLASLIANAVSHGKNYVSFIDQERDWEPSGDLGRLFRLRNGRDSYLWLMCDGNEEKEAFLFVLAEMGIKIGKTHFGIKLSW